MKYVLGAALSLVLAASANAQVATGFEAPDYAIGVITGQNGWYVPVSGSAEVNVAAYGGDGFGFAVNPTGGEQFIIGHFGPSHARAQLDLDFSVGTVWEIAYDHNVIYDGSLAATDNIASVSMQPSTTAAYFIPISQFAGSGGVDWNANLIAFSAAGTQTTYALGGSWANLEFNHWYRQTWTIDFATNQVLGATITDLATGASDSLSFTDIYLFGGSAGGKPLPTGFRFFASGNAANIVGWDNFALTPEASCFADFNGDGEVNTQDFLGYLGAWSTAYQSGNYDAAVDCNGDNLINTQDFLCFLGLWSAGC